MTCAQIRDHLPSLAYGDVPAEGVTALEAHLAGCAACRRHLAELRALRPLLDKVAAAAPAVDLPVLYENAADRQERYLRRWRRLAIGSMTAAAVLLIVLGLRLEVRVQAHQVVVRWGRLAEEVRPQEVATAVPAAMPPAIQPLQTAVKDLEILRQLIHALADNVDSRDRMHQDDLRDLQEQIQTLQERVERHWAATQRVLTAATTARPESDEK
jgi:hypothetical protein